MGHEVNFIKMSSGEYPLIVLNQHHPCSRRARKCTDPGPHYDAVRSVVPKEVERLFTRGSAVGMCRNILRSKVTVYAEEMPPDLLIPLSTGYL